MDVNINWLIRPPWIETTELHKPISGEKLAFK